MKILTYDADRLLFEKIKSLANESSSWRCLHLALSERQVGSALRTHFYASSIAKLLEEEEGYIYLCNDGDIFILFQGALKPIATKLGKQFSGIQFEQLWHKPEENPFTIYDLSVYWQRFYRICQARAFHLSPEMTPYMGQSAAQAVMQE